MCRGGSGVGVIFLNGGTNCKLSFTIRADMIIIQFITMKMNDSCVGVDGRGGLMNQSEVIISNYNGL